MNQAINLKQHDFAKKERGKEKSIETRLKEIDAQIKLLDEEKASLMKSS